MADLNPGQFSEGMVPGGGRRRADISEPEYRKHYGRGWATSSRATEGALDRADMKGEPEAWYDGYSDHAVGRPKHTYLKVRQSGGSIDEYDRGH